jgi:NADH-quinone oxidoreductase subunit G
VVSLLSGNLMDVCPVGAITTRDYRFKARPWDNPHAVDTICTLCEKGCNTTAWIKAKPEWAKGARLIRMTPRLNEEVNSYWMCDIGRFDYHWIESDRRVLQPALRRGAGLEVAPWADALVAMKTAVDAAGGGSATRLLVSAHASLEELHVLKQVAASTGGVTISWRHRENPQPERAKFKMPPVDAPNVRGARDLGFDVGSEPGVPPTKALRDAVAAGQVKVLYVFDPGPDGSIGETDWIVNAKKQGRIQMLVVHGVLHTALASVADILLPASAFVEKDATYTNATGHVQAASRVIEPPGEAGEDWIILSKLGLVFGRDVAFANGDAVRAAIAHDLAAVPGYGAVATQQFKRPVAARHWLQSSNPSERWKWDFMFQDLPPVKFGEDFGPLPRADVIPLKEVK